MASHCSKPLLLYKKLKTQEGVKRLWGHPENLWSTKKLKLLKNLKLRPLHRQLWMMGRIKALKT